MSQNYDPQRLAQSSLDLKQNAAFVTAIQRLKQDAITAWALTKPDEAARREECWQRFQAVESLEAEIDSLLAEGKALARAGKIGDT